MRSVSNLNIRIFNILKYAIILYNNDYLFQALLLRYITCKINFNTNRTYLFIILIQFFKFNLNQD